MFVLKICYVSFEVQKNLPARIQHLDRNSSSLLYQLYLSNVNKKHGAKSQETQHYLKPDKKHSHTLHLTLLYIIFSLHQTTKKCAMMLLGVFFVYDLNFLFSVYPVIILKTVLRIKCFPVKESFCYRKSYCLVDYCYSVCRESGRESYMFMVNYQDGNKQ